ncbi:hypothetical protein EF847_22555 [Actinobacteria bacterium YIM 96077]|uniref:(2Fe-2S) ferredoxin domain-containing protein n=1 Tax=Phytoactinopolyspora halophila TaxID=1981511 RepID=A0A329QP83_9ACTN|nr:(2Fe-2S) ferredoxin domain-containing protein [Phytoactinopolyspora halophila]AYY15061.1 hypothetical protein EF847_22555 [Actinobacteria bacterium YIM 96077]RAW14174.1 hypothetical protein DPM12_10965 [Phytoactinopolyspora halophila]
MNRQIVLVGRALGAPTADRALGDLAQRLADRAGAPVRAAMLDHGERSVHDALDACADDGSRDVLILPVQVPRDRYVETWVAKAAAHWMQRRREERIDGPVPLPRIGLARAVGGSDALVDALRSVTNEPSRPVSESPEAYRSANWSQIGAHRYHVLVCRGPRCSSHGAPAVARALGSRLQEGPVGHEDVLITNTGCLVPCNLGPIVVVQPDDVWYTSVDPEDTARIVEEHLHEGRVVEELRVPRTIASPAPGRATGAPGNTSTTENT